LDNGILPVFFGRASLAAAFFDKIALHIIFVLVFIRNFEIIVGYVIIAELTASSYKGAYHLVEMLLQLL
jgi:hypothetical protein